MQQSRIQEMQQSQTPNSLRAVVVGIFSTPDSMGQSKFRIYRACFWQRKFCTRIYVEFFSTVLHA